MDFCPRCGRYLEDGEYRCPECGYLAREPPEQEQVDLSDFGIVHGTVQPIDLRKSVFNKWFLVAFAVAFAIAFSITYYWRFSFLFFMVPLFMPVGKLSIGVGAFAGITGGTLFALLFKYCLITALV